MSVSVRTPSRSVEFVVSDRGCEVIYHREPKSFGWFEPNANSRYAGSVEYPAELRTLRLQTARGTRAGLAPFAAALLSHPESPSNIRHAVSVWFTEYQAYGGRSPKMELNVYGGGKGTPGLTFRLTVRPTALAVQSTDFSNDADLYWYNQFIWAHAPVTDAVSVVTRITSAFPSDLLSLCRDFAAGDTSAPLIDWLQDSDAVSPIVKAGITMFQHMRLRADAKESRHQTNRRASGAATS